MAGTPLRCCAGCGGSFLGYTTGGFGFYCGPCAKRHGEGFDPQPGPGKWQTVRLCSDKNPRDYVVLAREGQILTLRPLGRPDVPSVEMHVNNTTWRR